MSQTLYSVDTGARGPGSTDLECILILSLLSKILTMGSNAQVHCASGDLI